MVLLLNSCMIRWEESSATRNRILLGLIHGSTWQSRTLQMLVTRPFRLLRYCVIPDGTLTSHLTPHTSHLTPHTSHLTPHTSHLTPHTSHLTPHSCGQVRRIHSAAAELERLFTDAAAAVASNGVVSAIPVARNAYIRGFKH
jgi:hypothetical protein